ncbi:hypothetical protein FGM00_11275 [Aggregatimonas sangjinii]|uniref:Conjugative transposon protein TraK n=1 Tax=Aggregatimonas sangjinii TaxID=2583587 RepID=A0A5B7SUE5_9FLAO|nr:hypothetical protein [Aggregatimonas sangjinii]QCX00658.1 hypothetical protein FGM00_11275 [Aggregatimonas sangjinii]
MNLNSLKDIPTSFALAKKAIIMCFITTTLLVLGSLSWAFYVTKNFAETAYILTDHGQMALAKGLTSSEVDDYRLPEIKSHIYTFHRLFWNIDQFLVDRNMNIAMNLTGESGKQLYLTLKAKGHYTKIKTQNLIQNLQIDSVSVDANSKPYKAAVYGKLKVSRTDQQGRRTDRFTAYFDLHNVARTDLNPHGLLIENYDVSTSEGIDE